MSTAFHPRTDRLSEISTIRLTQYPQALTTSLDKQWHTMLQLAESTQVMSTDSSTDQSPFKALLGYITSIQLHYVMCLWQHYEMQSLSGAVFVEQLQAFVSNPRTPSARHMIAGWHHPAGNQGHALLKSETLWCWAMQTSHYHMWTKTVFCGSCNTWGPDLPMSLCSISQILSN